MSALAGIPEDAHGALCVLASGSKGNCSVLVVPKTADRARRVILLDAGLSPSRTNVLLHERGIRSDEVDEIVFTHLDSDHCHSGWVNAIRPGSVTGAWRAKLRIHRLHMGRAERMGLLYSKAEPFEEMFEIGRGVRVESVMLSHDDLGVAVFRVWIDSGDRGRASIGYATDLGRVTNEMIEHLRGVDVLAIESNYCPVLQENSGRPAFLKKRIMGGAGHLSNEESAVAVSRIEPREALVLMHLSQECNEPAIAMGCHRRFLDKDGDRVCVISQQHEATGWVAIRGGGSARNDVVIRQVQGRLFGRGAGLASGLASGEAGAGKDRV